MNLVETRIPDVTKTNIDRSKEIIANNIIKNVFPLFDEVYTAKVNEKNNLKKKLIYVKDVLQAEKESFDKLIIEYNKAKKISQILERIKTLVSSGLLYDGQLKHETVILLKILDKLPEDKLNQQLNKTIQILNKRFAK